MAKLTLLDMTQNILSAMDSDDINDLGDTTESLQVAEVIKETYYAMIAGKDYPFLKTYTTLTALGDTSNPTKMRFPTTVDKVYWIKYNKADVTWMDPKDFQDLLDNREEQSGIINSSGYILNRYPSYWTTFDDDYIYFDSIDTDDESTLQASNSAAYMLTIPTWTLSNTFTPTLPDKMFPILLADAKGTCFLNFKQTVNAKEERKAKTLTSRMQNEAHRNDKQEAKSNRTINYGRR